jgi:hypothetical protein
VRVPPSGRCRRGATAGRSPGTLAGQGVRRRAGPRETAHSGAHDRWRWHVRDRPCAYELTTYPHGLPLFPTPSDGNRGFGWPSLAAGFAVWALALGFSYGPIFRWGDQAEEKRVRHEVGGVRGRGDGGRGEADPADAAPLLDKWGGNPNCHNQENRRISLMCPDSGAKMVGALCVLRQRQRHLGMTHDLHRGNEICCKTKAGDGIGSTRERRGHDRTAPEDPAPPRFRRQCC